MKKIYVVGENLNYADFIKDSVLTSNMNEADIVLFTGGEDVSPALYGADPHPSTFFNKERDQFEVSVFKKVKPTQLALGICRGSQLLCVMNGGKLVQDCRNHAIEGTHGIINKDMMEYEIKSAHHQMQYPYDLKDEDYEVIYISSKPLSKDCYSGDGINTDAIDKNGEPEIVLYHKEQLPRCLAIQGRPESMGKEAPVVEMLNCLIDETLIQH